jgi:membrane protease YdiL (CAAX protease family)
VLSKKFHNPQKLPLAGLAETPKARSHRFRPLGWGLLVSALAAAASYLLPEDQASSGVALVFLISTYLLCLRVSASGSPEYYGLTLGGLMESSPLSARRLGRETLVAFLGATLVALIVLPPFWWGFTRWYEPTQGFDLSAALSLNGQHAPGRWLLDLVLWHVIAVALPEEAFFRGYLQSTLSDRSAWPSSGEVARTTWSILIVSALFACGHLATDPHPARLAVFFPSLLFGLVRARTGGIGAAVFLHAECNVFSQLLGQGYGLY